MGEDIDDMFLQRNFGENDGYLYSYEYIEPYAFDDRGPDPSKYSPLPFQPENHLTELDPAPIASMVQAINHAPDAQFSAAVSGYMDLNSFFRELGAENFLADQDSIIGDYRLNNFFLYRFRNGLRSTVIPWDKSNAFWSINWEIFHNFGANVLTTRAFFLAPELRAVYKDTLREAADIAGGPGGWLEQEIMKQYQQIRQDVYEDNLKLCDQGATGYLHPCTNEEFEAEVAYLLRFAQQRSAFIRAELASTPY
jgi:spore coat protein CotH